MLQVSFYQQKEMSVIYGQFVKQGLHIIIINKCHKSCFTSTSIIGWVLYWLLFFFHSKGGRGEPNRFKVLEIIIMHGNLFNDQPKIKHDFNSNLFRTLKRMKNPHVTLPRPSCHIAEPDLLVINVKPRARDSNVTNVLDTYNQHTKSFIFQSSCYRQIWKLIQRILRKPVIA